MSVARRMLDKALDRFGLEKKSKNQYYKTQLPVEFTEFERQAYEYVKKNRLSITYDRGLIATILACRHVSEHAVPGDFVECGVWRGGNAILAAMLFKEYGVEKRVYLFDTFEGMTEPTEADVAAASNKPAIEIFRELQRETHNDMCYASFDDVQSNFRDSGLLTDAVRFIQGDVLQTLRDEANLPHHIALLRLDTDWYESTRLELDVLYPRLSRGGILIIDDYGYWTGARKAADEYFSTVAARPFLQYVDFTGRMAVKLD